MPFLDVLVHRAVPLLRAEGQEYAEGESEIIEGRGTPFDCCLFLPQGQESSEGRGRRIRRPTLLVAPEDDAGLPVALSHEDELMISAPELNVAEGLPQAAEVRYQVQGAGQPFGRPGFDIIGKQFELQRVEEGAPSQGLEE